MSKGVKEWHKVIEIAEMLGFSKVTVYNKIKTINSDTLQGLQKKEKGITYYNQKAVDIIRDSFKQNDYEAAEISEDEKESIKENISDNKYLEKYISELENEVKFLKEQIKVKDDLIVNHVKLIENEQVLRREDQQAMKLLEDDRAKAIDEKMDTWRKEHYTEPTEPKNEDGFLKRIFKKKDVI